jgi:NAD(P)-dependent dehydrogenase (short-subunit alcohol dehydrogenase family)
MRRETKVAQRRKAFVTGASRGIGKAIAIRLAQGGFDVAITARTIEEGEQREHSSTVKKSDTTPLPGSLTSTADTMRAAGAEVLVLPADLLDRGSLGAAATTVLERWGTVDLVVHNARFIGPGHMDLITDTPVEVLEKHVQGNAFAPLVINRVLLPAMLKQGGGTIIYITSGAAYNAPPAKAGKGGWGLSYAMSKAAGHSIAGLLAVEYADQGIRAFNIQPGAIKTERIAQDMAGFGFSADDGTWQPPEVIGEVAYWLATSPEADAYNGECIQGQELCHQRNLLAAWNPKAALDGPIIHPSKVR